MISLSSSSAALPINSIVTSSAEHGIVSPLDVSKTRQSDRSCITAHLQFFNRLYKVSRFFEPPVYTRIPYVGHYIEFAQTFHHALAYGHAGHFPVVLVADIRA